MTLVPGSSGAGDVPRTGSSAVYATGSRRAQGAPDLLARRPGHTSTLRDALDTVTHSAYCSVRVKLRPGIYQGVGSGRAIFVQGGKACAVRRERVTGGGSANQSLRVFLGRCRPKPQVSFQTASKVLNGTDVRVAPETATRVQQAVDALDYRPNALARSLHRRTTSTIGLVIANLTDTALAQVAVGVQEEATLQGHAILLASLPTSDTHAVEVMRMLFERRVDGVIVAPPQLEEDFEFARVVRSSVPQSSSNTYPVAVCPLWAPTTVRRAASLPVTCWGWGTALSARLPVPIGAGSCEAG